MSATKAKVTDAHRKLGDIVWSECDADHDPIAQAIADAEERGFVRGVRMAAREAELNKSPYYDTVGAVLALLPPASSEGERNGYALGATAEGEEVLLGLQNWERFTR